MSVCDTRDIYINYLGFEICCFVSTDIIFNVHENQRLDFQIEKERKEKERERESQDHIYNITVFVNVF